MAKNPKNLEQYELRINGKRERVFSSKSQYEAQHKALKEDFKAVVKKLYDGRGRPVGS